MNLQTILFGSDLRGRCVSIGHYAMFALALWLTYESPFGVIAIACALLCFVPNGRRWFMRDGSGRILP